MTSRTDPAAIQQIVFSSNELPAAQAPPGAPQDEPVEHRGYMLGELALMRRSFFSHSVLRTRAPVFMDMSHPYRVDFSRGEDISVFIPRDALDALLPKKVDLHGFAPQGVSGLLLAEHLCALVSAAPVMTQAVNVTGTGARQKVITQPGIDADAFFRQLAHALASDGRERAARLCAFGRRWGVDFVGAPLEARDVPWHGGAP